MKLTQRLCKQPLRWLLKNEWKRKNVYVKVKTDMPPFFELKGVPIVNAVDEYLKPKRKEWYSPVPDDPRWAEPPAIQDHPNWHDTPMYQINPDCRLLEGTKQALILTKSQEFQGLPKNVQDLVGKVKIPDQDELIQRYILQAFKWDTSKEKLPKRTNQEIPGWKFKREFGIKRERSTNILLLNLQRLCQSLGGQYPDLLLGLRHLPNHFISSIYNYEDNKPIQLRFMLDWLISSSRPLAPFAAESEIDSTVTHKLPDIFPVAPTIDLVKENIYREENVTGFKGNFTHHHPHTLIINNQKSWHLDQLNARALLYCFGTATAYAKHKYGCDTKTLPEPVSVQCVHSGGTDFNFVFFQLNTLDMTSSDGIKNMAWFDSENFLFNRIEPKRSMLRNTKYEDYDPSVFEKILAMYLNGVNLN